jgi:hypothetical protein
MAHGSSPALNLSLPYLFGTAGRNTDQRFDPIVFQKLLSVVLPSSHCREIFCRFKLKIEPPFQWQQQGTIRIHTNGMSVCLRANESAGRKSRQMVIGRLFRKLTM